jgi:hypothetical protein
LHGWESKRTSQITNGFPEAARTGTAHYFDPAVVGGLTGDVEGEEMKVSYPGFSGGDRTDLRLPDTQQKLLELLQATGKPVVLVLTTGSALAVDWAKNNLPAILVAWYAGQRGGSAVADVLFGAQTRQGVSPSLSTRPRKSCRRSMTTACAAVPTGISRANRFSPSGMGSRTPATVTVETQ